MLFERNIFLEYIDFILHSLTKFPKCPSRVEYYSDVWGRLTSTYLLDRVESNTFQLINALHLTSQLPYLRLHRDFLSLSLFYKYYFGRCSEELSYCVPSSKNWGCNTRLASSSHELYVEVGHPRIDRFKSCFFPYIDNLWNSLPPYTYRIRING